VPLAPQPAVLQVREMQRIGVHDCGVDPEDLSKTSSVVSMLLSFELLILLPCRLRLLSA
jgi:hypothetical protein